VPNVEPLSASEVELENLQCNCFASMVIAFVFGSIAIAFLGAYSGSVSQAPGTSTGDETYALLGLIFALVFAGSAAVCSSSLCLRTLNQHTHNTELNARSVWLSPMVLSFFTFVGVASLFLAVAFYTVADNDLASASYATWWWIGIVSLVIFVCAFLWVWFAFGSTDACTWVCCPTRAVRESKTSVPTSTQLLLAKASKA
jgi:cytochrome bd-type quinol oxidase subunit 2